MKIDRSKTDDPHFNDYTREEQLEALGRMRNASNVFYLNAFKAGVHPFLEFCGLMNEFIKLCEDATDQGLQFHHANTHSGVVLPFKTYHAKYLAEKLNCIYGPALHANAELRRVFIEELFDGRFELVERQRLPPEPQVCPQCGRQSVMKTTIDYTFTLSDLGQPLEARLDLPIWKCTECAEHFITSEGHDAIDAAAREAVRKHRELMKPMMTVKELLELPADE